MDISANTQIAGASAIAIAASDGWTTDKPIWLVENQALFDRLDWLPAGASGSLIYYGGQLSNLLLDRAMAALGLGLEHEAVWLQA